MVEAIDRARPNDIILYVGATVVRRWAFLTAQSILILFAFKVELLVSPTKVVLLYRTTASP